MKLLLDENLSPRLVGALVDVYPGSAHVHHCGLGSVDDTTIWQYAKDNGYAIVSKDSDFQERSVLRGHPPKIIWLRATNCTSAEIEGLLRAAVPVIARFLQEDKESCLVLGVRAKTRQQFSPPNISLERARSDLLRRQEASLERNFDRTLTQLERLQRMRLGQPVLPKLEVQHSLT